MITVAIAGLGRMGAAYDMDAAKSGPAAKRSHLGAVLSTDEFQVTALADPSVEAQEAVKNHWGAGVQGAAFYENFTGIDTTPDVMVFATPPDARNEELRWALEQGVRMVVFEKPVASDYAPAKAMQEMLAAATNPPAVIVNYHRRYDESYNALANELQGTPEKIIFHYAKGLTNNAPHHVDFLLQHFGGVKAVQTGGGTQDNPSFICSMEAGFDAVFVGFDGPDYDVFNAEIYYADRCIKIENGGCEMSVQYAEDDLYYKNYSQLGARKKLREAGQISGLKNLYADIAAYMSGNVKQLTGCTLEEAVKNAKIIETVRLSQENSGKITPVLLEQGDNKERENYG